MFSLTPPKVGFATLIYVLYFASTVSRARDAPLTGQSPWLVRGRK